MPETTKLSRAICECGHHATEHASYSRGGRSGMEFRNCLHEKASPETRSVLVCACRHFRERRLPASEAVNG